MKDSLRLLLAAVLLASPAPSAAAVHVETIPATPAPLGTTAGAQAGTALLLQPSVAPFQLSLPFSPTTLLDSVVAPVDLPAARRRAAELPPEAPHAAAADLLRLDERGSRPELASFRHIVVDVRGSRGGNGDVAAGYLTALDIIERTGGADAEGPRVSFVMDDASQRILGRMFGRDLQPQDTVLGGRVAFHTVKTLPKSESGPADLYMALAQPDGDFTAEDDFIDAKHIGELPGIPVGDDTVYIAQTVLGNTENWKIGDQHASVTMRNRRFRLNPAGLARHQSGVYLDPVAWKLKDRKGPEIEAFLKDAIDRMPGSPDKDNLSALLRDRTFRHAAVGLAYGVGLSDVKPQFERYLKGLAAQGAKDGSSFVIVTPSKVEVDDIQDRALLEHLRFHGKDGLPVPQDAEPGKVHILRTGTMPHPVFVGLMAHSQVPPVLSGDGAMSAALVLGRPFVMTRIDWNGANVDQLRETLEAMAAEEQGPLIDQVYRKMRLERVLEVDSLGEHFRALPRFVANITDSLLDAASSVRAAHDGAARLEDILSGVGDPVLARDLLMHRAFHGDKEAGRRVSQALAHEPQSLRAMVDSFFFHPRDPLELGLKAVFYRILWSLRWLRLRWLDRWIASHVRRVLHQP